MARANGFEAMAREAAERIDGDREMVEQLTMLPDEIEVADEGEAKTRGKGKALSQMREFLAAQGYRMPEEVIAQIAGLASTDDPVAHAMKVAERVLAWAESGATTVKGEPAVQTVGQRLRAFENAYASQLRAADALMPYGAPKATPDPGEGLVIPVAMVPAAPSQAPSMRDVTPVQARRMVPADVAYEFEQKQAVSEASETASDGEDRTE